MKQRKMKVKRVIALMLAMLLIVCSFINTGTGYVYADENEYQKAGEEDAFTGVFTEEPATEVPTETSTEEIKWSGRFVYMGEEDPEELSANGAELENIDGELNADGTIDNKIFALPVNFTNHAPIGNIPVLNTDGSEAGSGPAVMYAMFMVGDTERALSLFCIDHGAPARRGDLFTMSDQEAYRNLNKDQKTAISYVLGCDAAMKQAPNSGSGFNENIDFNEWNKYYATQLMIWYYINEFRVGNTGNNGITWEQVVATCAGGYGDQSTCNAIKAQVDSYYQVPSFAINKRLAAPNHSNVPNYKLSYTGGKYQTTLTNTNAACNLTYFFGAVGNAMTATVGNATVTYTRISENQIKVTSDKMIPNSSKSNPVSAERSFMPQMGNLTYLINQTKHSDTTESQDFIECIDARQGDPVGMVFDVYTESTGTIRVYKEAITAMNEPYSMKGAVYGIFKTKADAQTNQNPINYLVIDKKDSGGRWYGDAVNPVPFGTYYVRETETPHDDNGAIGHWKLDTTVYTVKVTESYDPAINVGKTTDVTSKEQNYTAQIHVVKKSSLPGINNDQNSMVGAVYGVFKTQSAAEAASVDYATSDAAKAGVKKNGAIAVAIIGKHSDGVYGNANGLPLGTYYVKEVYAPSGWTLDETIHKVDASSRNTSTYVTSKTVTSTETPEYSLIYVGKVKKTNPFEESGFDIGSGTDMTMAGAEYGVFKTKADAQAAQVKAYNDNSAYSDNRVATIVTDKTDTTSALGGGPDLSGFSVYGISKELPRGTYYIVETKAPQGWLRDRTIYQKATSKKMDSGVYYGLVSSQEMEQSAAIEVYKTDATGTIRIADATLKGAQYGVYKTGRPGATSTYERIENATIITDKNGYGYIEGVPEGLYYVKEEVPAPGYRLDPNWYPVEVTSDMVAGVTPAPKVESKETPILTDYEITKVTVEDNSGATDPLPLPGCTFALYLKSDLDAEKLTYDTDGKLKLQLIYDNNGRVITEGTVLDGVEPYYMTTTGEDGKAVFKNCYMGDYIVVETVVGNRKDGNLYKAIQPYEVTLPVSDEQSGYEAEVKVELIDEFVPKEVRIEKVNESGERISGAELAIVYPDETGKAPAKNADGSYCILKIAKIGVDGHPIINTDGTYVMEEARWISDKDLQLIEYIPLGRYFLVELTAPEGYALAEPVAFTISDQTEDLKVTMVDKELGRIRIYKTGDQVTAANEYTSVYGPFKRLIFEQKPLQNVVFGIYTESGELIEKVTTGTSGYAESGKMQYGTYYVQEMETPAGLVKSDQKYYVTLNDETPVSINAEVHVTNDVGNTEINVYKQGEILNVENGTYSFGKKALPGVVFGVYANAEIKDYEGNVVIAKDECVGFIKTGMDGKATLKEALVGGEYYYKEVQTIDGYVLDSTKRPFTLQLGNDEVNVMEVNKENPAVNRLYRAKIQLVKCDAADHEIKLDGVEFELYRIDANGDQLMGTYVTDKNGLILIDGLPYGSYYFKEVRAKDNYVLDASHIKIIVNGDTNVIRTEFTNERKPDVPKTGDAIPIVPVAATAIIFGILFLVISRTKRRNKI